MSHIREKYEMEKYLVVYKATLFVQQSLLGQHFFASVQQVAWVQWHISIYHWGQCGKNISISDHRGRIFKCFKTLPFVSALTWPQQSALGSQHPADEVLLAGNGSNTFCAELILLAVSVHFQENLLRHSLTHGPWYFFKTLNIYTALTYQICWHFCQWGTRKSRNYNDSTIKHLWFLQMID